MSSSPRTWAFRVEVSMDFFVDLMEETRAYKEEKDFIMKGTFPITAYGLVPGGVDHLVYSLNQDLDRPLLVLCKNELAAREVYESIQLLTREGVYFLPKKEVFLFPKAVSSRSKWGSRLKALVALVEDQCRILVTSIEALGDPFLEVGIFQDKALKIALGEDLDLDQLVEDLVGLGYERVQQVEGRGQFAKRGGLIDIYGHQDQPLRLEFFDTEVDSIRSFDVLTQRSLDQEEEVIIYPYGEFLYGKEDIPGLVKTMEKDMARGDQVPGRREEKFQPYLEELKENGQVSNPDLLLPYLRPSLKSSLLDYFKERPLVFLDDGIRGLSHIEEKYLKEKEEFQEMLSLGEILPGHLDLLLSKEEVLKVLKSLDLILGQGAIPSIRDLPSSHRVNFAMKSAIQYKGRMDLFLEEIADYQNRDKQVLIFGGSKERCQELLDYLTENHFSVRLKEDREGFLKEGVTICPGSIHTGYEAMDEDYIILNHGEIYGQGKRKKKVKKKTKALNFEDLKIGDYVVHESHGIGEYVGTKELVVQGIKKDYINISYRGGDQLFLPMDQLNVIHKFIGKDGVPPRINRLNSPEWNRTKIKAKKAVEVMAQDLIDLYARRDQARGFAFSKDDTWQREFEDAFIYEPTDGQIEASREIKRDMESKKPMDRLLCADVGYGKTEVALRAAFKAILDGKQVAFLVPTTILAQQHYNTVKERFADFPVSLSVLSRFRTAKEQKEDLKALKEGRLDMIIGTHRLLSKDIHFKDLGLLIIDEEQRFGVRHKEALKMLKENVDTLTLTATPIPRTLQMSMVGIRDMSVINEPPEERFPIQTYVVEQNDYMVREAILKEVERGGQVYLVYNKVASMESKLDQLKKLVPEVTFAMANGQMSESQLENTMLDFFNGEIDVLLCSTIIETGMDVKNANTMIVYQANHLGLSQLYQLRGRIGRSNRIAYCYLTYEKNVSISELAEKRLQAIKEFTEFGSGFKIAMRDLEIRGSGSILGSKQSGHIDAIGYDLYVKYLKEAIANLKGEDPESQIESNLDLAMDAYIDKSYIKDSSQRLEIYKKMASLEDEEDYEDLLDELIDRFGDPPRDVLNLLKVSLYRSLSGRLGVESIVQKDKSLQVNFAQGLKPDLASLNELKQMYRDQVFFSLGKDSYIHFKEVKNPLNAIEKTLKTLKKQRDFTKISQNHV